MPRKRYTPEQIISKLREAEVLLSKGGTVQECCRQLGITENTYYRWRKQYGLNPEEKIVVFWTKEMSLPHFNRYRVRFRKVYSGRVGEFNSSLKKAQKSNSRM